MRSSLPFLVVVGVVAFGGGAVVLTDAFLVSISPKKLSVLIPRASTQQKSTTHVTIPRRLSSDDDDAIDMSIKDKMVGEGIRDKAMLESREREIELISRLDPDHEDNNVALSDLQNQEIVVSELWSLWYGERGPLEEMRLRNIEEALGDPSRWEEAEKQYLELINEHCKTDGEIKLNLSNWVEPANRLATLLYLMGRLKESKAWCEAILEAKPWHVGALSGVVMVCLKLNDEESAKKFISMGLPNLSAEMRDARKAWVQRNVDVATQYLLRLHSSNAVYEELAKALEKSRESTIDGNSSSWQ